MTQNPHHLAGSGDWMTPLWLVDLCREVTGAFDLDPASSDEANAIVMAKRFFTARDDGLEQPWAGTVFLNPPGTCNLAVCGPIRRAQNPDKEPKKCSCELVPRFWQRLLEHYLEGTVPRAAWIGFQLNQLANLQPFTGGPLSATTVILRRRVRFLQEGGGAPTRPSHNNYVTFLGADPTQVQRVFQDHGVVVLGAAYPLDQGDEVAASVGVE